MQPRRTYTYEYKNYGICIALNGQYWGDVSYHSLVKIIELWRSDADVETLLIQTDRPELRLEMYRAAYDEAIERGLLNPDDYDYLVTKGECTTKKAE